MSSEKLLWYYDFISPFAYLQSTKLDEFADSASLECRPLLFAGLLDHWSNVGPAEIPPKRNWTFQHVTWLAHRDKIAFSLPAWHPFNPLPLLRLALALDNRVDAVQRIYRWVWVEGHVPQNETALTALLEEYALTPEDINTPVIKTQLRRNGELAIEQGVFGVPTLVAGEQIFWGYDATEMAHAYLQRGLGSERWPADAIEQTIQLPEGPGRNRPRP
ncbi:MAG: DsbA family protein [Gammaproteobacteria bacterium]|nr:DsbA family protein [Gammaproteobacteria bacterium]